MTIKAVIFNNLQFIDNNEEQVKRVQVSPELARILLSTSTGNRTTKRQRVESYAKQMREGTFPVTFDAISLNLDLQLCNGHHRLMAIILSGMTITAMIGVNGTRMGFKYTDVGASRSSSDQLQLFSDVQTVCAKNKQTTTVANHIIKLCGGAGEARNLSVLERVVKLNEDGLKFIEDNYPCNLKGLGGSGVKAAILAAFYQVDSEKLSRFSRVLNLGILEQMSGESNAALLLRQILTEGKHHQLGKKVGIFRDDFYLQRFCYHLTTTAIASFCDGSDVKRINPGVKVGEDNYPIFPKLAYQPRF